MDLLANTYTPSEVAAFSAVPVKRVYKAIEQEIIVVDTTSELPFAAAVYMRAVPDSTFTVPTRRRLFTQITIALAQPKSTTEIEIGGAWKLELGDVVTELASTVTGFKNWKASLEENPDILGGEAVFPGTRLAVRNIGGQLERGESRDVLLEDYPYLTEEDLTFAPLFVKAYPRVGRPRSSAEIPRRRARVHHDSVETGRPPDQACNRRPT